MPGGGSARVSWSGRFRSPPKKKKKLPQPATEPEPPRIEIDHRCFPRSLLPSRSLALSIAFHVYRFRLQMHASDKSPCLFRTHTHILTPMHAFTTKGGRDGHFAEPPNNNNNENCSCEELRSDICLTDRCSGGVWTEML